MVLGVEILEGVVERKAVQRRVAADAGLHAQIERLVAGFGSYWDQWERTMENVTQDGYHTLSPSAGVNIYITNYTITHCTNATNRWSCT